MKSNIIGCTIRAHTKEVGVVRTTINLDDELLEEARRITGMEGRTALIHEGLRALIERESARRLARLGGSEAQLRPVPRRRPEPA
jgi:Arc/MetJ family transcription regulator